MEIRNEKLSNKFWATVSIMAAYYEILNVSSNWLIKKGINKIKTSPIRSDAIRIGGTESFRTNFVIGKALPCAIAIKSKINRCFKGN